MLHRLHKRATQSALCVLAALCLGASAQTIPGTTTPPPTDTSTQASPIAPEPHAPVDDASAEASPVTGPARAARLPVNTKFSVRIEDAIDSTHVRNGDVLSATLAEPLNSRGASLKAGTHVAVTVISVASAGKLESTAEMTLQVVQVGSIRLLSNILEFHGKLGHRDLPDSAPAKGTEAAIAAGTVLQFYVAPLGTPATN